MRQIFRLSLIAAGGLLMALGARAEDSLIESLCRIHLESLGGQRAVARLESLHATGTTTIGEEVLSFDLWARRPNRLRVETRKEMYFVSQGYDGYGQPWQKGAGATVAMSEAEAREFMRDADFDDPLIDPEARGFELEYAGEAELDGQPTVKVLATRNLTETTLLWLDTEHYMILQTQAKRRWQGRLTELITRYEDYEATAGVQLARKMTVLAGGQVLHVTRLETVRANPELPEGWFSAPP